METPTASPFASSLLFDYVATYMYEGDQPNAERRAAALALDRELLRELLGQEELRELIDPGALETVEADLQRLSERTRADSVDALHDVLRRVGDLTLDEAVLRGGDARPGSSSCAASGGRSSCGWAASSAGSPPRTPACTATRSAPSRRPACRRRSSPTYRTRWSGSCAATPAPTARSRRARCATATALDLTPVLERLEQSGDLVRGELRPGGTAREWCDPEVLRRLRRASLAALRAEIEPADQRAFARFQASWQGVDRHPPTGAGIDRLREVLVPLQGLALPLEVWERDVLPRRTGAYSPVVAGSAVRVAARSCGSARARWAGAPAASRCTSATTRRCSARRRAPASRRRSRSTTPIRERLQAGPCFFTDLLTDVAGFTTEELQNALWDLVWAGEATNDAFAPLRSPKLTAAPGVVAARPRRSAAHVRLAPARRRAARRPGPLVADRARCSAATTIRSPAAARRPSCCWSATASSPASRCWPRASRAASRSLYDSLAALETIGIARRGYFVEGLGGAQFALPGRGRAAARAARRRRGAAARARRHRPRPALRRRR